MTTALEEAFTTIADKMNEPYGVMFDMAAIRAFGQMPCGGCENSPTWQDVHSLEGQIEALQETVAELEEMIKSWGLKND